VQIKKKKFIAGEQQALNLYGVIAGYHSCLVAMWRLFLGDDKVFGCVTDYNYYYYYYYYYDSKGLKIINNTIVCRVPLPVSGTQSSWLTLCSSH
jgi:hypothetical protein